MRDHQRAALAGLMLAASGCRDPQIYLSPEPGPVDAADPMVAQRAQVVLAHDAATGRTGLVLSFEGDPVEGLRVSTPDSAVIDLQAYGALADIGVAAVTLWTPAPSAEEMEREALFRRFPEGVYTFVATAAGGARVAASELRHDLPAPAEIVSPAADTLIAAGEALLVRWLRVDGAAGYHLALHGAGDPGDLVFDVTLPPTADRLTVPARALRPAAPYRVALSAVGPSGNRTLTATPFATGGEIDAPPEAPAPPAAALVAGGMHIDHDPGRHQSGYGIAIDAAPWNVALVQGPYGEAVLDVGAAGALADFGLVRMELATHQPAAGDQPLHELLGLFPQGSYEMLAVMMQAGAAAAPPAMLGSDALSHGLPRAAPIVAPADGAQLDAGAHLEVRWDAVMSALTGDPIDVVGYEVVVARQTDDPSAFVRRFRARVPADTRAVTVPGELIEPGAVYDVSVIACERSGNCTRSRVTVR